ncbi:hypothetical protein V8G54_013433 [Vigna mungo]|uniref:Uncharacterized protein n=1 Tax=Vigna mungo TaxID=3915 RepID=A0AAQ3NVN3_VIGMU
MGYLWSNGCGERSNSKVFNDNEVKYEDIFAIVDRRKGLSTSAPFASSELLSKFQVLNIDNDSGILECLCKCVDNLIVNNMFVDKAGVPASIPEPVHTSRGIDFSPGQPLQSNQHTVNLGVIGRNSTDLGPVGDNFSALTAKSGEVRDQIYNFQMLEVAHLKLPQPKDSECPRTYTPKHPTITPPSFPQVQAPLLLSFCHVSLHSLFSVEHLPTIYGCKRAKETVCITHGFNGIKMPKVATDEYEHGTYLYFDFRIANDDMEHGW